MIETYCRPLYQKLLVKPIGKFAAHYCSANCITILSLLIGICVPFALLFIHHILAVVLLLISGYLDTLDGTVARMRNDTSNIGCVFDIVTDRVVEFGAVLGLFFIAPQTRGLYCILMLGSILICVTSFLVVGVFTEKDDNDKSFFYSVGLMERAEAFIFFIAMIFIPSWFAELAIIFIILVTGTGVYRVYEFILSQKSQQLNNSLH